MKIMLTITDKKQTVGINPLGVSISPRVYIMNYANQIKDTILDFNPTVANRYFLFGSFVKGEKFHDIDLGVVGNTKSGGNIADLKDKFYDSKIPYKVDIVDIDEADPSFRDYVLNKEKIVWLKLK